MENVLAKLDNGKYGLTFSAGLGAQTAIISLFKAGDGIIVGDDVYGGTFRLFSKVVTKFNIEISFIDFTNLENLKAAIKPNTKVRLQLNLIQNYV